MIEFKCEQCGTSEDKYTKKLCHKCYNYIYSKKYYKENKQKFLDAARNQYYNNKEESLKYKKEYAQKNKEKIKKYQHEYYKKNYVFARKNMKEYYEKNKTKLNKKAYLKKREACKNNIQLRLREQLASRMGMAIKHHKGTKQTSSLELLGVTDINIVRQHLEKQFKDSMTWDNHGTKGWHIDHIKPCCDFDLTKKEEQLKCFHYTNLRPLWYLENINRQKNLINIQNI